MKVDGATRWCCAIYLCQILSKCADNVAEIGWNLWTRFCAMFSFFSPAVCGVQTCWICGVFATGYLQFGYAYPYCQSWRSSKHHIGGSCGPVAPSTVHSIWWNMRMIFVGEGAHMHTPVTCELRHLCGCNMGRFPVCFWSCAIYGSGKHNQTAHTPVAKTPQIQPCSPNTKYVFAVLRGTKMAQVRRLYWCELRHVCWPPGGQSTWRN